MVGVYFDVESITDVGIRNEMKRDVNSQKLLNLDDYIEVVLTSRYLDRIS